MAERHNTIVCSFDPASPCITAWGIHEWIYASLKIPDYDVQIDRVRREVFIKLIDNKKVMVILRERAGQLEYKYPTGEVFQVTVALAGMGTKCVRIANHWKFPMIYYRMHWLLIGRF
jgi:hypothetical protein